MDCNSKPVEVDSFINKFSKIPTSGLNIWCILIVSEDDKMTLIYTISIHFLGPYIVDLLSENIDKAAAKILHNRRTQSYHEQLKTRYCQEKFKHKENLENAKPEDPKTGNILSKLNTNISKKPELVKNILNTVINQHLTYAPI